jgi:hypothetical protein
MMNKGHSMAFIKEMGGLALLVRLGFGFGFGF